MVYLITEQGDKNHLDGVTRERMHDAESDLNWLKLIHIGWFFIGMVVGSILHDGIFHG